MRALVTGCAGFIGSHLTESLLGDGFEVLGIDCFNDNYGRRQKLENLRLVSDWNAFEFAPIDLARGDLDDIVDGCDVVFHLAAEPGVRASWSLRFESYVRNNVLATQHLLEAAKDNAVERFVYASSSSIYGQAECFPTPEDLTPAPFSPYGVTKLSAENLCHLYRGNYGLPTVALRYFSVYGPRQRPDMAFNRFCRAALLHEPIEVYGDGGQTRDFTYVEDIVAATRSAAVAAEAPGKAYNVGGGSRASLADALRLLEGIAGKTLDLRHLPAEPGDVRDTAADIRRAEADLAFRPATRLEEGLAAEFEWMAAMLGSNAFGDGFSTATARAV